MGDQNIDQWNSNLQIIISRLKDNLDRAYEGFDQCIDAGNSKSIEGRKLAEALQIEANKISPAGIHNDARELILEIESWYITQHNQQVSDFSCEVSVPEDKYLLVSASWFRELTAIQMASYKVCLDQNKQAMVAFANDLYENTGWGSLVKAIFGGYNDPIDGIKALWGGDATSKKTNEIISEWQRTEENLHATLIDLMHDLEVAVVDKWNVLTVGMLKEIELESQRRITKKIIVEKNPFGWWGIAAATALLFMLILGFGLAWLILKA